MAYETGVGVGGGQRRLFGNYLLGLSRGRKRHLEAPRSLQMHEGYFARRSVWGLSTLN